ncbi:hypothetical protein BDV39DRAFT_47324 [Aspergillus sergii]|uniref:Azaphilone pigments biosynthesis cluster protein L N-terminal domain-containing protein n=1 Tax=Aspergillus sergii TaxID=1034303 RepID=A0A5N6X8V8_9EURO|nr:hypothetical protein BDV39DRAFT_47324 [Aspergillus sergii]
MENAPSLDGRPSTLAVSALSASSALYHIVESFQSPPISIRDFLRDLRALMEVLTQLIDIVGTATDIDPSALVFTLSRCSIACNEFKEEIKKQLPFPDDGSVSPQSWARLRYMGGNIDIVRHLLCGYKSAFEVIFTFTNL